jgi:hypothetical protein
MASHLLFAGPDLPFRLWRFFIRELEGFNHVTPRWTWNAATLAETACKLYFYLYTLGQVALVMTPNARGSFSCKEQIDNKRFRKASSIL